jgi:hypothetical protein
MPSLVTLNQAYAQLRIDYDSNGSDQDDWLVDAIEDVSDAVALWLKDQWRLYVVELDSNGDVFLDSNGYPVIELDSNGEPIVRPAVRRAVLLELASQFRFREGEGKDNVVTPDAGHGYVLNKASTAILAPLRRSTLA